MPNTPLDDYVLNEYNFFFKSFQTLLVKFVKKSTYPLWQAYVPILKRYGFWWDIAIV